MPIHDLSYQHWAGQRDDRPPGLVLGWSQLRLVRRRKIVWLPLLVTLFLFISFLVILYSETRDELREMLGFIRVDAGSLRWLLAGTPQRFVHFFLCIAAGADLIALDRRHRALQIYLARPVDRRDYVIGKGLPLVTFLSLASWIPALVLVLLKLLARGDLGWLREQPWVPLSIVAYSASMILCLTLLTLAISSLSASPRLASAQLFGVLALSQSIAEMLAGLTHHHAWKLLSIWDVLDQFASWVFREPLPHDTDPVLSAVVLLAICSGSIAILRLRVRPIDVVGGS